MDLNQSVTDVPSRMLPGGQDIPLTIAAYPLAQHVEHRVARAGMTLAEMLDAQGCGGTSWEVCVGGVPVPAERWRLVRVRPGHLVEIRPRFGKSVLAVAAMIALTIYAPYLTTALVGIGGAAAIGSVGVALVTGAIMMGGSLVINKIL